VTGTSGMVGVLRESLRSPQSAFCGRLLPAPWAGAPTPQERPAGRSLARRWAVRERHGERRPSGHARRLQVGDGGSGPRGFKTRF
jgi:hypothetical protein